MSKQFVVIGLGRLGSVMAKTLDELGHTVLAIDQDETLIQNLTDDLPHVHLVAADATDEAVLRDLGVQNFDGAAVVIGGNIQAGILATVLLKELGVPHVISRASSATHAKVLDKIGADRVIQPEKEMGAQVARTLASPAVLDYVDLGGDEAIIETEVPEKWLNHSLAELQLSRKHGLTVLALKAKGQAGTIPRGDTVLHEGDVMVVGGSKKNLDRSDLLQSRDR
ncbi:MAG TPA: TrkA family potassium uptake protein [Rubrobacteraceae bacterium]|nr:TrkA family potassium uptake protein [Rubrobacteraceae bacterium]